MGEKEVVIIKRRGGKYEGIGFVLILISIIIAIAGSLPVASIVGLLGFIVFLIGRFM